VITGFPRDGSSPLPAGVMRLGEAPQRQVGASNRRPCR